MIGIIPAAGKGSRLGLPYPKELVPITHDGGRVITVIEGCLQQFAYADIHEAVIVISREKQIIKDYLGDERFGVRLHYVYQNRMYSKEGLTDACMSAYPLVKDHDLCVMLMGDVHFTERSVTRSLVACLREVPAAATAVSVWQTFEPHRFGITTLGRDSVLSVVDKPEGLERGYHWGAAAWRPDFWFYLNYETETFSKALHRAIAEQVVYHEAAGQYLDLGTPFSLIEGIVEVNG